MAFAALFGPIRGVRTGVVAPAQGPQGAAIDHGPFQVQPAALAQGSDQGHMGRLPDARAGPRGEAAVAGTARAPAQFRRQGLPAKAFPEDKDDAVEAPAVRDTAPPSLGGGEVLGQQRGQGIPQFVGHQRFHGRVSLNSCTPTAAIGTRP